MAKIPFLNEVGFYVVNAGTFNTVGGDANESITAAKVASGDIAIVTVKTKGGTPVSIVSAAAGAGAIAIVCSADPAADHVLQYVVYRAV